MAAPTRARLCACAQVEAGLGEALQAAYSAVGPPCVVGLLSLRLTVGADGAVREIARLADTLVVDPSQLDAGADPDEARADTLSAIVEALDGATFAPSDGETTITIPFTFD